MELRGERLRTAITAALLSALTLACGRDSPTEPEPEGPTGWIYYQSGTEVDGNFQTELRRIRPDGTGDELVFGREYGDVFSYEFRPDFGRIAAVAHPEGQSRSYIVTMAPDGSDQVALTAQLGPDFYGLDISWDPAGTRMAFTDYSTDIPYIATLSVDGVVTAITPVDEPAESSPFWSPRGDRIAYQDEDGDLVIMDADGKNPTLVGDGLPLGPAAWSPDGSRLVLSSQESETDPPRLYLVEADGSGLHEVTPTLAGLTGLYSPYWLDDDDILFRVLDAEDFRGLYRMRSDGSETELVLTGAGDAAVSTDGRYIVVAKEGDLWVRELDGGTPKALGLTGTYFNVRWVSDRFED